MMIENEQLCPFVHWKDISSRFPQSYYLQKDGFSDFSWFTSAPKYSTFRVNTKKHRVEEVIDVFTNKLQKEADARGSKISISSHPLLTDCVVIGPWDDGLNDEPDPSLDDVIVDVPCANAVLRGAHVFAPAVLGLLPSTKIRDRVNICADIDHKCLRGHSKRFEGRKFYVGKGIVRMDRDALYKNNANPKGVGLEVVANLSRVPLGLDLPTQYGLLQNLPSLVCGAQFAGLSGRVLDMCAAPGHKTTHIATILQEKGRVTALDVRPNKIPPLRELCRVMGLENVDCHTFDSTKCIATDASDGESSGDGPPFRPASFSAVLLDPPCSALGLRPALSSTTTLSHLKSFPTLQRKLFNKAVEAVAPGGTLVYSTCTITVEENEDMVAWALATHPQLSLQEMSPPFGRPGLHSGSLSDENQLLVRRFGGIDISSADEDTIGFFIAKFVKK